jgi:hypothetical protein
MVSALNQKGWLDRLTAQMDLRKMRLRLLRSYLDGDAPLPEGAEGVREAYQAFQRIARTNYGEVATDAVAERMTPSTIRVGDNADDDDVAREIWNASRLDIWSSDVHRDMLGLSKGYVVVQPDIDTGDAEIVYQRPEQAFVEHDPSRPDKRRAGVLIFRDDVFYQDHAYLHLPGKVWHYTRAAYSSILQTGRKQFIETFQGGWQPDEDFNGVDDAGKPTGLKAVPIIPFINRAELSEFEPHIDLLNRINWTILQRLVITAMQAYRQRAVKGELPEKDESGQAIDYGQLFKPGPGSLWELPEGVDLWESSTTDLGGILESSKADILMFAAVTRTPMASLMPESQNQSAEGASFAREGLVFKTDDRIARASASWGEVMSMAIELQTGKAPDKVYVDFMPAERQSMTERYDALSKAGNDVPWRTKMTKILGFSGDEVDRMAAERAEDAMLAATLAPPPLPASLANPPAPGAPPDTAVPGAIVVPPPILPGAAKKADRASQPPDVVKPSGT